jgi:hypothetical protein
VSLSYLQWTVDIVDYNSSFKFNRIVTPYEGCSHEVWFLSWRW